MPRRVIAIGMDHVGFPSLESVLSYVKSVDPEVETVYIGPESTASVDYPDYAQRVAEMVASGEAEKGILICGTGIGMSIAANKVPGVRAALCHDHYTATMSREHNDANVLCAGYRVSGGEIIRQMIEVFMKTPFSAKENHARRIAKMATMETSGKK